MRSASSSKLQSLKLCRFLTDLTRLEVTISLLIILATFQWLSVRKMVIFKTAILMWKCSSSLLGRPLCSSCFCSRSSALAVSSVMLLVPRIRTTIEDLLSMDRRHGTTYLLHSAHRIWHLNANYRQSVPALTLLATAQVSVTSSGARFMIFAPDIGLSHSLTPGLTCLKDRLTSHFFFTRTFKHENCCLIIVGHFQRLIK